MGGATRISGKLISETRCNYFETTSTHNYVVFILSSLFGLRRLIHHLYFYTGFQDVLSLCCSSAPILLLLYINVYTQIIAEL